MALAVINRTHMHLVPLKNLQFRIQSTTTPKTRITFQHTSKETLPVFFVKMQDPAYFTSASKDDRSDNERLKPVRKQSHKRIAEEDAESPLPPAADRKRSSSKTPSPSPKKLKTTDQDEQSIKPDEFKPYRASPTGLENFFKMMQSHSRTVPSCFAETFSSVVLKDRTQQDPLEFLPVYNSLKTRQKPIKSTMD